MHVPITCIEGMWRKATELLRDRTAIVAAPSQSQESRMVINYSGKVPHMVTPTKGGGFSCDSNCPNWKSIGFCAHSIVVSELNGKLSQFVSYLHKKKKVPSVTKLITSEMPVGRGRKGTKTPRRRKLQKPPETRVPMPMAQADAINVASSSSDNNNTQSVTTHILQIVAIRKCSLIHLTPFPSHAKFFPVTSG